MEEILYVIYIRFISEFPRSDDPLLEASDATRPTPSINNKRVQGMQTWQRRWIRSLIENIKPNLPFVTNEDTLKDLFLELYE